MLSSDFIPLILRSDLKEILNLPSNLVKYLVDSKKIITKTIGNKVIVSNKSLKKFQMEFKRDDYYTKKEFLQLMREKDLLSPYEVRVKMYHPGILGYPHAFQFFKQHNKIKVYKINKSEFVEKKSAHLLITEIELLEYEESLKPIPTELVLLPNKKITPIKKLKDLHLKKVNKKIGRKK
jgi:hypothetical protein